MRSPTSRRRHPPSRQRDLAAYYAFDLHLRGRARRKTKFTVRWQTLDATAEEQKTFDTMHDSMTQGWGGTMDQLAAYLASAK